ncbi:photosystem reaction center subunit H [Halobacteriales archaeon QS_4_69_34]|nr:MAG: photosystem reaction center subunit H [Halobacteriales archaeon QS_4_69_34]
MDPLDEIGSLIGREVYSNRGTFVGEIEDVRLDLDARSVSGLAVGSVNGELFAEQVEPGQGIIVPYRWVRSVGDVVLVSEVVERLRDGRNDREDREEPAPA